MADVNALISAAINRADYFANAAAEAIAAIDASKGSIGYASIPVDPTDFAAKYVEVPADTTPMPVYEAPPGVIPDAPTLVSLHTIDNPALPAVPTLNTTGLFNQTAPSSVMPDWNEANPALHVDEIYNELAALAAPILRDVDIPSITPLTIRTAPELVLPDYELVATPEAIPAPENYAAYMQSRYDKALPEMKAFVDDIVDGWVTKFAPEYYAQKDAITAKIAAGLEGEVLPDQFEAALYSRSRARVETEYKAAEKTVTEQGARKGFMIPPGAVVSALNKARVEGAKALAGNSTEVYIERRKMEVQHLQFVMTMAAAQIQSVRNLAVQYAQHGLGLIGAANNQSVELANKLITVFEHERSRHEFSLAIMKALNDQYEVRLKAALAGLEGFKTELEALKLQKDVEFKQIEGAKLQVEVQQILVNRYSAMVDAIAKRAVVDELKIKEYGIRADVFKTNIQARLAAFEAYKASLDGDKAKLSGELAKLDLYEGQLKAASLGVEVQSKILDADVKTNAARLGQYEAQLDSYKIGSEIALQKFTSQAEIKKLGLEIYKTNIDANIEVYKGALQKDIAFLNARIEAFKGNIQSLANFYRLQQGYTELELKKTEAIASGYTNMASATLQSLNSSVSAVSA
jgi:hypothetical protein